MIQILELIPKCNSPEEMKDFHHILLCNVVYKIFTKVLTNCLKSFLLDIVSEAQSVFVLKWFIIDNFLIAFELLHYVKRKVNSKKGDIVPRLIFLKHIIELIGFFLE